MIRPGDIYFLEKYNLIVEVSHIDQFYKNCILLTGGENFQIEILKCRTEFLELCNKVQLEGNRKSISEQSIIGVVSKNNRLFSFNELIHQGYCEYLLENERFIHLGQNQFILISDFKK